MSKAYDLYKDGYADETMQKLVNEKRSEQAKLAELHRSKRTVTLYDDAQMELISSVDDLTLAEVSDIVYKLMNLGEDVAAAIEYWLPLYGGDNYLYISGAELWHKWDDTRWTVDYNRSLDRDLQTFLRYVRKLFLKFNRNTKNKELEEIVKAWLTIGNVNPHRINSMKENAQTFINVNVSAMDQKNVFNLRNGTYDFDTFTFKPHDKNDLITHCAPFDYDENAKCPLFEEFLRQVCVNHPEDTVDIMSWKTDEAMIAILQEFMGYALTNKSGAEASLWLEGDGANGKSVFIETLSAMLGSLAMPFDFDSLLDKPEYALSTLPGVRLIFSTEASEKVPEKQIKGIISGEQTSARAPYGKAFSFHPICKVIWAMNEKPRIKSRKNDIWRRMILMPFNRSFSNDEKDIHLKNKLRTELPGIFNFALAGLKRLQANEFKFSVSETCEKAKRDYQKENNNVIEFLDECCVTTDDFTLAMTGEKMYEYYAWWVHDKCENGNFKARFGQKNFGVTLKGLVKYKRTEKSYLYCVLPTRETTLRMQQDKSIESINNTKVICEYNQAVLASKGLATKT